MHGPLETHKVCSVRNAQSPHPVTDARRENSVRETHTRLRLKKKKHRRSETLIAHRLLETHSAQTVRGAYGAKTVRDGCSAQTMRHTRCTY